MFGAMMIIVSVRRWTNGLTEATPPASFPSAGSGGARFFGMIYKLQQQDAVDRNETV